MEPVFCIALAGTARYPCALFHADGLMDMRGYLVAGNWKMNGGTAANQALIAGIVAGAPTSDSVELLVCPPFPYLSAVASQISESAVALGAQNVSEHESGAFTGETAGSMLRESGCKYVIVGHSERRALMGEASDVVAAKFQAALESDLQPILCVGETLLLLLMSPFGQLVRG
jgi:triosephosphate isomerase